MGDFLASNDWQWRLLRTIAQGVLGVVIANLAGALYGFLDGSVELGSALVPHASPSFHEDGIQADASWNPGPLASAVDFASETVRIRYEAAVKRVAQYVGHQA